MPLAVATPCVGATTTAIPVTVPVMKGAKSSVVAVLTWTVRVAAPAVGPVREGVPVPVNGATRVMAAVTTSTCAVFTPTVAGLKVTVIEQALLSCATTAPSCSRVGVPTVQVPPVILKSVALAPLREIEFNVARVPAGPSTAATRIVRVALVVPAVWLPKSKGDDVRGVP